MALAALPARLLLVLLLWEAWKLRTDAAQHGHALLTLAWLALVAWLVSLAGRAVFVHACRIATETERPHAAKVLRVPWSWWWAHLRSAMVLEVLFWATAPALVLMPLWIALAGMAAVQAPAARAGAVTPLRDLVTMTPVWPLFRLTCCFIPALAVAIFAVVQAVEIVAWASAALPMGRAWTAMIGWNQPLFVMLACAGGTLLIEPFWIAALVALDRQDRACGTGDDLRAWHAALQLKHGRKDPGSENPAKPSSQAAPLTPATPMTP